jgi:hypothetical protein
MQSAGNCELRLAYADGTLRKAIALPDRGCGESAAWTADQRWVVYTQGLPPDRRPAIKAVEIATGQTKQLREGRPGELSWVLDSNVVVASEMSGAGPQRKVSIWQIDLNGKAVLLREFPFAEPPGSFVAPINRSMAMVMRAPRDFRLIRLDGSADERVVSPEQKGYVFPLPSFSTDNEWTVFRINPSGNDGARMNIAELVRTDGTARRTIELPFFAHVQSTPVILPGAKDLIVAERPAPGAIPGVFLVNVATGSVTRLFDYAPQGRFPEIVASPDGRSLLALSTEVLAPSASAMDFSHMK